MNICQGKGIPVFLFFLVFLHLKVQSQAPSFNFRHLTTSDGLSDDIVRAVTQDKYGFIWIGTSYGLNRFDGISIKTFFSKKGDSSSLPDNYVQSLYRDTKGNLWVGTLKGLSLYDYAADRFMNYTATKNIIISDIHEDKKGNIWLATNDGLWIANEQKKSAQKFTLNNDTSFQKKFHTGFYQIVASPGGDWYLATNQGIKIFNPLTFYYDEIRYDPAAKFSISSDIVFSIAIDASGCLWAACAYPQSLLNKIDLKNHTVKLYDYFSRKEKKWSTNIIRNLFIDKSKRLWAMSAYSGLSLYNEKEESFTDYKSDPLVPNSLLSNQSITIFQDSNGIIWIGGGYGLSYFNPDKNLFYTIFPSLDKNNLLPENWARAACEDKQGNLWLGTGKGLAKYDHHFVLLTTLVNEDGKKPVIHSNSIRSLLYDDLGDLWIGTAKGLNRYHPSTKVIDFFDKKQGIPLSFFWMLTKDKDGEVWVGSAGGLYHYLRSENRFDDLSKDSLLSPYAHRNVQALFTDNHNRLWIGLLNVGVIMYDIAQKKIIRLTIKDSLISDTRISSFAEDKNGFIWIGSEEGLTCYNPQKNSSRFFTRENGLPSNRTNNVMVDALNRLWIGTSNGLCMLNRNRDNIKRFDINDGLLTNQFNEQSAYRTSDGLFLYPTYKGFLVFRPEEYKGNSSSVPIYITSFKLSDKELKTGVNTEVLQSVHLRYNQNFFSINLAGLNYMNPEECTYAYKMEPFDKDWIYTGKREIKYTNVPAGDYTFRYKAITDNANRNVTEKTLRISVASVFYKTWWFRLLMLLVIIGGLFAFYSYRIQHREKILVLQGKAQLLEKEKALVMYESLKQQLNPHFLFNSLTSLSSLIQSDPKIARQFLDQMSKIYRYILKSRQSELVPLIEEIKFVEVYIKLQQTRFRNGLQVAICVSEEFHHRKIVPVTLQNLVENAIKHNIIDDDTPLFINMFVEDDYMVVQNNLQKKNFVETSNQQGLMNMQSLYRYLSNRPVEISENKNFFTIKIPLI
jgi:ligand-binding sensor domain-containing protein